MRVPIPIVIVLCLIVTAGVWWHSTRNIDFLTPPPADQLAKIRAKVEDSQPPADHLENAVSPPPADAQPPSLPVPPPEPAIEMGDITTPPVLQQYAELAPKGAAHLIALAQLLENAGATQRALLAWERVLDVSKPNPSQAQAAISAIKRLRHLTPAWNTTASTAVTITLQIGTGKKNTKDIQPILKQTASELELASSGILKITTQLTAARDPKNSKIPTPVALWLSGPGKKSRSTEVLSFHIQSKESLHEQIRQTTFNVLRSYLARGVDQTPLPPISPNTPALDAFNSHITRLQWRQLGALLNYPIE